MRAKERSSLDRCRRWTAVAFTAVAAGIGIAPAGAVAQEGAAVQIVTPSEGAVYAQGQRVLADYSCSGQPVSCVGTVPDGQPIDTATPGTKTFSVTADYGEGTVTEDVQYAVRPVGGVCRATGLRTGDLLVLAPGITLASANTKEVPCATDYQRVLGLAVPLTGGLAPLASLLGVDTGELLRVGVVEGLTVDQPNDNGTGSAARVANARINVLGLKIEIGAIESHARARMDGGCADTTRYGYSHVASVNINGQFKFAGYQPATIPLLGLGHLRLNQQVRQNGTVTQRPLFLDLPGTSLDIVLGETKAGYGCF